MGKLVKRKQTLKRAKKFGVATSVKKIRNLFKKKDPKNAEAMIVDTEGGDDRVTTIVKKLKEKKELKKKQKKAKKLKAKGIVVPAPGEGGEEAEEAAEDDTEMTKAQKINEKRLKADDIPLFIHPKAKNISTKTAKFSGATVLPTRRMTKKAVKKVLNAQRRAEKAAVRAEDAKLAMDLS